MPDGLLGQCPVAIVKEVVECMLAIPRWIFPGPVRLKHVAFFPVETVEQALPQFGDGGSKKHQQLDGAARSDHWNHHSRHRVADQNGWLIEMRECARNRIGVFAGTGVGIGEWQIHRDDAVAIRVQQRDHLVPNPGILAGTMDQRENAHALFETSAPE